MMRLLAFVAVSVLGLTTVADMQDRRPSSGSDYFVGSWMINPAKTVGYTCWWTDLYKLAGEEPPPGSKNVEPYRAAAHAWWRTLDAHSKKVIETRLGLPIKISPEIDAPAEE